MREPERNVQMTTNAKLDEEAYRRAFAAVKEAESEGLKIDVKGTCQACFSIYVVKQVPKDSRIIDVPGIRRGKLGLVLHGYERPGIGHVVGMCWGAGHPPYELSCELTKQWCDSLVKIRLPNLHKRLAELKSNRPVDLAFKMWVQSVYAERFYIINDGQPIDYDKYPELKGRSINLEGRRRQAIADVQADIKGTESTIDFLKQRIRTWTYAPDRLIPHVPSTADLSGKAWFESAKVQAIMTKLPSPAGDGRNFLAWALAFPRTLMWSNMRGGRKQAYYERLRDELEKYPEAIKAGVVLSTDAREAAEAQKRAEAKTAMTDAQRERAEKREAKEAKYRETIALFLGNPLFSEHLRARKAPEKTAVPVYSRMLDVPAVKGQPTAHDWFVERVEAATKVPSHTDRVFVLSTILTNLKDLAREAQIKVKIPRK